jgi:hypothetical protein
VLYLTATPGPIGRGYGVNFLSSVGREDGLSFHRERV